MLHKLERKLGRYAIPNLIAFLVFGQLAAFVLSMTKPEFVGALVLVPELVLRGEPWRLVSFLFIPPDTNWLFLAFALLLLYQFGQALEAEWGAFRFNAFVLIGWAASVLAAFAVPGAQATNVYLMGSIFLAFAQLNPSFELRLFFILPVKVRWLGWLTWGLYAVGFVLGGWQGRALIAAGVLNFFLFFGGDIAQRIRGLGHKRARKQQAVRARSEATHRCTVCGVTDVENPAAQFRYCSRCEGTHAYCMEHLRDHEHVRGDSALP